MAKSKYTTSEVFMKLREVDHLCRQGKTIVEAVECVGINETLYYRWREKYGWMEPNEYQRMKELENENERLKALVHLWVTTFGERSPTLRAE